MGGRKEGRALAQPSCSNPQYVPSRSNRTTEIVAMASSSAHAATGPLLQHHRLSSELNDFRMELYGKQAKKAEARNIAEREEAARTSTTAKAIKEAYKVNK